MNLRKDASAGVDGVTYAEYQKDVERNIPALHEQDFLEQFLVHPGAIS